jgi:hypothetical protein
VADGRARRALGERVARGPPEQLDGPGVAGRLGGLEMQADQARWGAVGGQQASGPGVRLGPGGGRHRRVDGGPHERMDEVERPRPTQDGGGRQAVGRPRGRVGRQAGDAGRVSQLGVPAQDGHGSAELDRVGGQRRQPQLHRDGDCGGSQLL